MIGEVDLAYIAGLFDGEGSINIKRGIEKKKRHKGKPGYRFSNSIRISMEITMTDKSVLIWPFAHVKLDKINKIMEYYADKKVINGNIIDLEEYRNSVR